MTNTAEIIANLTKSLNFRSEMDDFWTMFVPDSRRKGAVNSGTMMALTGLKFDSTVEFDEFMDHAIAVQDDKPRYSAMKKAFVTYLINRKVFKMVNSPHNYEYYVVGHDRENNIIGCCVTAVET